MLDSFLCVNGVISSVRAAKLSRCEKKDLSETGVHTQEIWFEVRANEMMFLIFPDGRRKTCQSWAMALLHIVLSYYGGGKEVLSRHFSSTAPHRPPKPKSGFNPRINCASAAHPLRSGHAGGALVEVGENR